MLKKPIKLNMNEVAYPPSEEIIETARKNLMDLNRYSDPDYMRRNVSRVIAERERIWNVLNDNLAVPVYKSMTNFLLIKTDIPDIVGKLADIGILISDLSNQLSSGFIRVSIGNREDNDVFIAGYMKICEIYSQEKF